MTRSLGIGKILIPIVIAIIIVAAVLISTNFFAEPNQTINEPSNDLQINIDQTSHNPPTTDPTNTQPTANPNQLSYNIAHKEMIDITSASIQKTQTTITANIQVNQPTAQLGSQESAYFDMILILEDDQDALQTYELIVDMNQTGTFCSVQDVQTKTQQTASLSVDGSTLTITTELQELPSATQAEWNIVSAYEAIANNKLIYSAYDFTPDEGLKTTIFATNT